jgi:TPR repeat protein
MNFYLKLILLILCLISSLAFTANLLDKAKEGHPNSQFDLALKEMSNNANYTSDWLLKAALQDHKKATHYLRKISNDKNPIINELRLMNLATQAFLQAYSSLAVVDKKELNKLRKIGNDGDVPTQYLLWLLYVNDKGIKKPEAYTWLKQAAGNNHPRALFSLGLLYYYGYIVPEEKEKAMRLIQKSSKLDLKLATIFLKQNFK